MDLDFPLILVSLVAFTGLVWLGDRVLLRPRRRRAAQRFLDSAEAARLSAEKREQTASELERESTVVEYAVSFFPVLAVVLVLRSFLVEPFQIPTGSMIPTLLIGDFILVNKYAYGIRLPVVGTKLVDVGEPRHGEIMVFIPPHEDKYFIKRVIGIPGDKVRYEHKTIFINGVEAKQEFVARLPAHNPSFLLYRENIDGVEHFIHRDLYQDDQVLEWTIPAGHYFMMGDNRDRSSDSRAWGLVPEENIVGKAIAIWVHKEPGWHLPEFDRNSWIE